MILCHENEDDEMRMYEYFCGCLFTVKYLCEMKFS